jgi:hypothetical protein
MRLARKRTFRLTVARAVRNQSDSAALISKEPLQVLDVEEVADSVDATVLLIPRLGYRGADR